MDDPSAADGPPVMGDATGASTSASTSTSQSAGTPDAAAETAGSPPDPRVQAALARLARLDALDVREHVEVYDAIHRDLRDALAGAPSRDPSVPE
jgi:hypothetical protein